VHDDVIGWGLVGAERHAGNRVAPAIVAAPNARLVGVVGRELATAKTLAERFGARTYPSLAELLADPAIRAVYLVTPNDLHAPQTLEAAEAGRHVLCEKPLALSPGECRAMIAACRAAGVKLGVGFHLRQHEAHRRARKLITGGALGEPVFARAQWAISRRTARNGWWGAPERAGAGILYGTGVHVIDLLRFVLGREVEAVAAWTDARPEQPLDSRVLALLRFSGGLEAVLVAARAFGRPDNDLVVHGPEGRLATRDTVWEDLGGSLELATESGPERWDFADEAPGLRLYADQVERFGRAILGDGEPGASGEDGLAAALVSEAIQRSAAEARTLPVMSDAWASKTRAFLGGR
jgi:1,5-anhydro-D-fructose reductase (1,5-anhydro-D-mannitol-forming)